MPIKICRKVVLEIEMYVDYDEDLSEEEVLQHVQESTSGQTIDCLLYTSPSPRDQRGSRMPSSA